MPLAPTPIELSETPGSYRRPAPLLGEHTDEILASLGYSAAEIAALRAEKVVVMSKAFVKEADDDADLPDEAPAIPTGVKNYMTPQGHRQLQEELRRLLREERPKVVEIVAWAAGNGDRSENGDYIYGKRACARSTGASAF